MKLHRILGLLILVIGIAMALFGVSMFAYRGDSLTPFVSKIGELSFMLWLPVVIVGLVLLFYKLR